MPDHPHVRHAGERVPFAGADSLSGCLSGREGEHVTIEFLRPSGITGSLFLTVGPKGALSATYDHSELPGSLRERPEGEITCADVAQFVREQAPA